jgi:dipeptidyl-peptidase 4
MEEHVARLHRLPPATLALALVLALPSAVSAQKPPSMAQFISPGYPASLVSAKKADRLAWVVLDAGKRNVYTAAAPDFKPVRLTSFLDDNGVDTSDPAISDDGSVVIFVRGHSLNREGWGANPTGHPDGPERAVWAVRTTGGPAWRLGEVTNPVLSPDGRYVAFVKDGQIYAYAVTRGAVGQASSPASSVAQASPPAIDRAERPLVKAAGSNASPRWSPDGSKLAFVSDRADHAFIGVLDMRKRSITFLSPSVDRDASPTWSPDGKRIAFIRRAGLPFGQQAQPGTGGIGNPPGPAYNPATAGMRGQAAGQRAEGGGQRGGAQAGMRGASAGGPLATVPGLYSSALPGGYRVAFMVADAATGEAREFWHPAADDFTSLAVNAIQWAGDVVLFTAEPGEWLRVFAVKVDARDGASPAGGTPAPPVPITQDNSFLESAAFTSLSPDGRTLFYCNNLGDTERRHVWKVPTSGGEPVQLTKGDGIETYPVPLATGRQVAMLAADARRPQAVALVPAAGGSPRRIYPTLPKEFPLDQHVIPEDIVTKAADGLEIHNQLFVPRDIKPGERRPALVFVHGGPVRQMLLGYHYMWFYHMAYAMNQWLAAQGYVVLSVNFRSGVGYGKSFRTAPNTGQRGNAEYQDVVAGAKYLQGRPDVDPTRVGIWGLSYGGLLTSQALARNSDIFVAGVDFAGVHLYTNTLDPDNVAYKSSAVSAIDTWKSPVLLIHGDDDRNVAFTQTSGLVQLLRARNVYHEVIVFPDDVHESLIHKRWLYTFDRMEQFLDRFVRRAGK